VRTEHATDVTRRISGTAPTSGRRWWVSGAGGCRTRGRRMVPTAAAGRSRHQPMMRPVAADGIQAVCACAVRRWLCAFLGSAREQERRLRPAWTLPLPPAKQSWAGRCGDWDPERGNAECKRVQWSSRRVACCPCAWHEGSSSHVVTHDKCMRSATGLWLKSGVWLWAEERGKGGR